MTTNEEGPDAMTTTTPTWWATLAGVLIAADGAARFALLLTLDEDDDVPGADFPALRVCSVATLAEGPRNVVRPPRPPHPGAVLVIVNEHGELWRLVAVAHPDAPHALRWSLVYRGPGAQELGAFLDLSESPYDDPAVLAEQLAEQLAADLAGEWAEDSPGLTALDVLDALDSLGLRLTFGAFGAYVATIAAALDGDSGERTPSQ